MAMTIAALCTIPLARLGGGLDIYITKNLAVYAEGAYMLTTGDIDEARYGTLGAGAMFRF